MAKTKDDKKAQEKWNGIETFSWCGYKWISRPLWGIRHEFEKLIWYDKDAYEILADGTLVLKIRENPKEFTNSDGSVTTIPYGRCSVRSVDEFKYGTFEWDMRLPYGRRLWPSLWFATDSSWPPEIDCMEGDSGDNPKYIKKLIWKDVRPNVHWSKGCDAKNGEHLSSPCGMPCRFWFKGVGKFDHYKVVWTPDYVDIWYNNHRFKRFDDREMLDHFNMVSMHPIMGTAVYNGFTEEMFREYKEKGIEMAVRNFKYTPYNNGTEK